jgi:hypothetical protein
MTRSGPCACAKMSFAIDPTPETCSPFNCSLPHEGRLQATHYVTKEEQIKRSQHQITKGKFPTLCNKKIKPLFFLKKGSRKEPRNDSPSFDKYFAIVE